MTMSRKIAISALALSLAPAFLGAYEQHLSSTAIRDAYFLGRDNDERSTKFLAQYVHRFPVPKTGPHIAEIEVVTPYAYVVERAREALVGYSAQQAEKDFLDRPAKFYLRVRIFLTPTYPALIPERSGGTEGLKMRPPDFWRDFEVRLIQDGHKIPARSVNGSPIYFPGLGYGAELVGAEIRLEYDTEQIASAPLRIAVLPPEGQRVETEFDLTKLK
jgi:hypothetical protein